MSIVRWLFLVLALAITSVDAQVPGFMPDPSRQQTYTMQRSSSREATGANAVGHPTGGNGEDHDGEAVGAENKTGLAIRETKLVPPDGNQRNRR